MTLDDGRTILINENFKSRVYEITSNDANAIVKLKKVKKLFVKFLCKALESNRKQ